MQYLMNLARSMLVQDNLTGEQQRRRFPNTRPLFEASMEKRLGFTVVIPRTGDYYVVFDNRKSSEPRQVKLNVKAERPARPPSPVDKPKKLDETRLDIPAHRRA